MPTLGAVMIVRLLGSVALAGVGTSLLYVARILIAYPIGVVMDSYGRRAGIVLGLALSVIGTIGIGRSMVCLSFAGFVLGMLVFGLGVGAGQQLL